MMKYVCVTLGLVFHSGTSQLEAAAPVSTRWHVTSASSELSWFHLARGWQGGHVLWRYPPSRAPSADRVCKTVSSGRHSQGNPLRSARVRVREEERGRGGSAWVPFHLPAPIMEKLAMKKRWLSSEERVGSTAGFQSRRGHLCHAEVVFCSTGWYSNDVSEARDLSKLGWAPATFSSSFQRLTLAPFYFYCFLGLNYSSLVVFFKKWLDNDLIAACSPFRELS